MCGRYTIRDPDAVAEAIAAIGAEPAAEPLPRRYNVAPTQTMPVVVAAGATKAMRMMKWGIVPFYARKEEKPMQLINARSETAAEKPTFKQSVQKRRCVVPADGFYEWRKDPDGRKTPFYIRMKTGSPFWIAGIFEEETLPHPAGYALLTTEPNELMKPIHDRMPVILEPEAVKRWLKPGDLPPEDVRTLCASYPATEMMAGAVSTIVNSARNDVPECVVVIQA
jgi:putative SOS response-associated peptidase YedK